MYQEDYTEPDFMKRPRKNPFRTPDDYFDSLEDRIMANIEYQGSKKRTTTKVFQMLKPVFGLAASFLLIYLLVYYPINTFILKDTSKVAVTDTSLSNFMDPYNLSLNQVDENSLVNAIFSDETSNIAETNPDEMLAYLSSGLNDLEIYAEIHK